MAHLTERLGVQRLCIVHCLIARSVSIALPTKESQPWLSRIDNRQALAWHATLLLKQPIGKFVLLRVLLRTQKHLSDLLSVGHFPEPENIGGVLGGLLILPSVAPQSVGRIQSQSDGPKARTRHRGQGILRNQQQGELCAGETARGATLQSSEENPNTVWKLSPAGLGQASLPPAAAALPLISCFIAYRVKAIEYDSTGTARKPKLWTSLTRNMKLGLLAWHVMRITIVVMISAPVGQGQGTMCSQKWASPWKPLGSSKEPTWHRLTLARQG